MAAGIRARDGKLWFPTQDGVAVVAPETMTTNHEPVATVIESVRINRRPVAFDTSVNIRHKQENFEIHYTALSLINSDQPKFRYRLDGLDDAWVEAGARRTAHYSHVPPGTYIFTVVAANRDGIWNTEGATLQFTVLPPFWRTWWFVSLSTVAGVGLIGLAYARRLNAFQRHHAARELFSQRLLESQERERQRIAADLHDGLGQNLLFIKNRAQLGALKNQGSVTTKDQFDQIVASAAQSIDEVRQIAHNLRPYQLDRLGLSNSVEEMIETVAASSEIRFRTTLADIDGVLPKDLEINVYRIVQEGVNNIVKHSEAAHAWIELARARGNLQMTIRDDGRGFEITSPSAGARPVSGFGLTGIAERVRMLGGTQMVTSSPGRGTTIQVRIPIRNGRRK